jgi:hypothetical protein
MTRAPDITRDLDAMIADCESEAERIFAVQDLLRDEARAAPNRASLERAKRFQTTARFLAAIRDGIAVVRPAGETRRRAA